MASPPAILWFRRDLRLDDHPALLAAASGDRRVLGVFVLDPALLTTSGTPRIEFLHGCLQALSASMNGRLLILRGDPVTLIPQLAVHVSAAEVHISADYMPYGTRRDEATEAALSKASGIQLIRTGSPYAVAPGRVRKGDGSPYAVYTPFYRAWSGHGYRTPAGSGRQVEFVDGPRVQVSHQVAIGDLDAGSWPAAGEDAALKLWSDFVENDLAGYRDQRNRTDREGTSRLSPYLKYGCVHPRTLLADVDAARSTGAATYRGELAWREFYADLVFHQPRAAWRSVDPVVDQLEYDTGQHADEQFAAWQQGRTGYPYIDAAMRQLLAEGWMHNRARMGVASFLIKDLHLPWQRGARHFMNHLIDGDLSSNNQGWQWVAGSGPQSAPYYRVFNPLTQGTKFDPQGDYVRRYVPELRDVPGKAVHSPWELPDGVPKGYPEPIVDHATERVESLRRWAQRPERA